jgi:hypothetical protein
MERALKLIFVPAVITLAVTLLRLVGELQNWSPALFNRQPGGGGALVGIVWLVPVFGIYFALQLLKAGEAPASRTMGAVLPLAALGACFASGFVISKLGMPSVANVVAFNVALAAGGALAARGWPALGKVNFAYGLAARIPVATVMLVAMFANWGTHYEGAPPGFPDMATLPKWLLIGLLPQLVLWVGFTVIVGGLFGGLTAAIKRR